nr:unnamed protein product [Callosobruchus analis]
MSMLSISLFIFSILANRIVETCFKVDQTEDILPQNYAPISTKIPAKDISTMEERLRNRSFIFDICPEEGFCLKVPLGLRRLSILDQNLHFDLHMKERTKEISLHKLKPIFVEGYHHDDNGENHMIGYMEKYCFYGQIRMSDARGIYYIEGIRAYQNRENINTSRYNAVVYKRTR